MCSCGSALRLIDSVHGKLDDDFVYDKVQPLSSGSGLRI